MRLYLALRGRAEEGYEPARDEAAAGDPPGNIWANLPPWTFRDPTFLGEFLMSWGHILRLLGLPAGRPARVLEYGPGSGQILLLLARLGIEGFGVDIDPGTVASINRQAELMALPVRAEQGAFGEGFAGMRFDRILFFEAFHHAFDFLDLMRAMHGRLAPGGRLVLAGEPVVARPREGVPYPWGPRLDALSVFCMRRFGWMELGFTQDFLMEAFRRTGWTARHHPFPACPRAAAYVAVPAGAAPVPAPPAAGMARRIARRLPAGLRARLRGLAGGG
jgi:SAM-dependent methyltransferase